MAEDIRVTAAAAYVERDPPDQVRVTAAAAYVELQRSTGIRATAAAAYVEFQSPWPPLAPMDLTLTIVLL